MKREKGLREMREVERVNGAHAKLFIVAGPVVEGGEGEVIEDKIAIERERVEPELVPEAYPRHVRSRRWRRTAFHARRRRRPHWWRRH